MQAHVGTSNCTVGVIGDQQITCVAASEAVHCLVANCCVCMYTYCIVWVHVHCPTLPHSLATSWNPCTVYGNSCTCPVSMHHFPCSECLWMTARHYSAGTCTCTITCIVHHNQRKKKTEKKERTTRYKIHSLNGLEKYGLENNLNGLEKYIYVATSCACTCTVGVRGDQ